MLETNMLWAMEANTLRKIHSADRKAALPLPEQPPQPAYSLVGSAAVIPMVGAIEKYEAEGVSTLTTQINIQKALIDPAVKSIVLFIDSPGGTVAGTADLANFLRAARDIKPITAYVSDHCYSAAYWIASQCSTIIANEGAFVGSIGVYHVLYDTSEAAKAAGVQVTLIAAGAYKGLGEAGIPLDPKALEETQNHVNAAYELFINSVALGRNMNNSLIRQLADGRVHIASQAQALKLIDAIGTFDAAILVQEGNKSMVDNTKVEASTEAEAAPSAPSDSETLKQLAIQVAALTVAVTKLVDAENSEDEMEPADKPAEAEDDGDAKVAQAVAQDRDRLKAICEACGARSDFAMAQYLAGKTPTEAKAALADVLSAENSELRKQANAAGGIEPLALASSGADTADDVDAIWTRNLGDVQKAYSGKKEYYLASQKYNKTLNKGTK